MLKIRERSRFKRTWKVWILIDKSGFCEKRLENEIKNNEKNLEEYQKKPYVPFMMREDYTVLSEKDEIEEFMFLGLRKRAGISEREFKERFRVGLKDIYGKVIAKYEEMDLLEWTADGKMLRLTDAGIDVSDYIFCDFML